MFAVVSLSAGAQAAQAACTEPTLGDIRPRAQEDSLVKFELTGLTPGSEYLVQVNGRERKAGVAETDTVKRRFRLPHMGDSKRRVTVAVVVANDGCENSPWKFEEKLTYRPAPVVAAPQSTPTPTPTPTPDNGPSPPPAPTPTPAPSVTSPAPTPIKPPAVPKSTITPTPAPSLPTEPPKDSRAWVTPMDPYQKAVNTPPELNEAALARTDLPSDKANSTGALLGLAGIFLLLAGIGLLGWTRFRRYDDQRLDEILNPEGKLPTHLEPEAREAAKKARKRARRKSALPTFDPTDPVAAAAAASSAAAANPEAAAEPELKGWAGRRAASKARKQKAKEARRRLTPNKAGPKPAPAEAETPATPEAKPETPATPEVAKPETAPAPAPAAEQPVAEQPAAEKPTVEQPPAPAPNGKPPLGVVPPIPVHTNGGVTNGTPPAHRTHREEVESELQRILEEAGLHTEVDGILADAKAEAQRQGVPIDSELMLKALCDETNGAAKLSDSAKGELESRFKRIAAEERGEHPQRG